MSIRIRKFSTTVNGREKSIPYYSLYVVKGKEYAQEIAQRYRNRKFLVRVTPGTPRGYWEIWTRPVAK